MITLFAAITREGLVIDTVLPSKDCLYSVLEEHVAPDEVQKRAEYWHEKLSRQYPERRVAAYLHTPIFKS
jgi:hypothetical protein